MLSEENGLLAHGLHTLILNNFKTHEQQIKRPNSILILLGKTVKNIREKHTKSSRELFLREQLRIFRMQ